MTGRRFQYLLGSIGPLRHACELDLLLFFHRHPRAILTSARLAAYVGYDQNQVTRSLERLADAGLLVGSRNSTSGARLYVLRTAKGSWVNSVLEIALTRDGRQRLLQGIVESATCDAVGQQGEESGRVESPPDMFRSADRIVGIGGSAGALQPLCGLLAMLPRAFPAAIAVVQHMRGPTLLPAILQRVTALTVKLAAHGEPLRIGTVYVAPPDHHLIGRPDGTVALSRAAPIRFARPSIDWWLTTMAANFEQRCIAVILSGRLSDGARGVQCVRKAGGLTFAQTPSTSRFPDMPKAALATGCMDSAVRPTDMGSTLLLALNWIKVHDAMIEGDRSSNADWSIQHPAQE